MEDGMRGRRWKKRWRGRKIEVEKKDLTEQMEEEINWKEDGRRDGEEGRWI